MSKKPRSAAPRQGLHARAEESVESQLGLEQRLLEFQKMSGVALAAGGIVHGFNNLLQGILGTVELALLEAEPGSALAAQLDSIRVTSLRLSELSKCLQGAYSGRACATVEPTSLNQVVEETSHLLAVRLSNKAFVSLDLGRELAVVEGDAAQLGQVVMNLVVNAAEALDGDVGSVTVATGVVEWQRNASSELTWIRELPDGKYVYLDVVDTGSGMDVETQRRIFEPFFSTKSATRGLGLPAVVAIVHGHRGAIGFSSTAGAGTTFRVLLPEAGRRPFRAAPDSYVRELSRPSGLVLVAENEPQVQATLESMLTQLGLGVLLARDGREAVELMAQRGRQVQLMILDLSLPALDGLQAMAEIHPAWPEVPAVLSSGFADEESLARAEQLGFAGFLQKPYGFDALLDVVRRTLEPGGESRRG